jgi:hypothetical protein
MATDDLPFIDRRCLPIDATPDRVWAALAEVLTRGFGGIGFRWFARVLGSEQTVVEGPPLVAGSTVAGFRIAEAEPERRVILTGRHRFSRYSLTFELDDHALCATTHAEFPGFHGSVYRMLVIGSRGHAVVVTSILKSVQRRAESPG